jgi:hypothetical protein
VKLAASGALTVMVLFGRANVVDDVKPLGVAAFAVSFSVVEKV